MKSIKLKMALLNAENLFLLFDQKPHPDWVKLTENEWQAHSQPVFPNKPLHKLKELTRCISDLQADIIMLCEVGGLESLKNFNELFLSSAYSVALIEGNSDRNIDVGYLIKKNSPFYFDILTNKNKPINFIYPHEKNSVGIESHKFSRDVAELRCFKKSADEPFLIFLLTHLKSRLDPERIDPEGFLRREAELKALIDIYNEVQTQFPKSPIVVAGDFNGNASEFETAKEFQTLYDLSQLKDVLSLANVDTQNRSTYFQVKVNGKTEGRQIDYCFLNPVAQTKLVISSAEVYRYKDEFGFAMDSPSNLEAKQKLPSDHYPVVFELDNLELEK